MDDFHDVIKPRSSLAPAPLRGNHATVYFDGGCSKGLGSTGVVLYDAAGQQVEGIGLWHGEEAPTNNVAEA